MDEIRDIVIVGGGLAAAKAAEAAREVGFHGQVTLFSNEAVRPYERPPLSKGFLVGDTPQAEVYVHDVGFYAERGIDLRLDTAVTEIDRSGSMTTTACEPG